jgi:VWFA-related protein
MVRILIRVVAGAAAAILLSSTALAQAQERVLYASVLDSKTKAPVAGLGPEAFRVREDGATREVLRVTPATTPMPVAVLIDDSQAAQATIADLRKGLSSFLKHIDGIGPIALVTVAARPTIHLDYTTDAKALQDAAGRIFAQPGTGATLLDAIVEVSKGLRKRESDRASIVVITTENVEYSNLHYNQVLDPLKASGAAMHAMVLLNPAGSMATDEARNRATVLDRGTGETGGLRLDVLTSISYENQLQVMAAALKNQYRVVYSRPQTLIPPDKVEVSATAAGQTAYGAPARSQPSK